MSGLTPVMSKFIVLAGATWFHTSCSDFYHAHGQTGFISVLNQWLETRVMLYVDWPLEDFSGLC